MRALYLTVMAIVMVQLGCRSFTVPARDGSPPTIELKIVEDDDINLSRVRTLTASSGGVSFDTNSDIVTVTVTARDQNGGIKMVELWSSSTGCSGGSVTGPGLAGRPTEQFRSSAGVGEAARRERFVAHVFDFRAIQGRCSSSRIEVWGVTANFHGGTARAPQDGAAVVHH